MKRKFFSTMFFAFCLTPWLAFSTPYIWNGGVGNVWENSANWLPPTGYPFTSGDAATFVNSNDSATITGVLFPATVGYLQFANTNQLVSHALPGNFLIFSDVSQAKLEVGAGFSATVSADAQLNSPLLINSFPGASLTMSRAIFNGPIPNGITLINAGDVTFSGGFSNTYGGSLNPTTINAGTLILNRPGFVAVPFDFVINGGTLRTDAANQFSFSNTYGILNGGTFDLNSNAQKIKSLIFTSGTLQSTGGTATLTLDENAGTTLTLNGGTTVPASVDLALTGTANTITTVGVGNALIQGNLDLGSNARTFNISGADLDISGIISGGIGGTLTKSTGANKLTFSGSSPNTYSELTVVNAGILELAKVGTQAIAGPLSINSTGSTVNTLQPNQFNSSPSATDISLNGGTFDLNNKAQTIRSLIFNSGALQSTGGTATLTLDENAVGTPLILSAGTTVPASVDLALTGAANTIATIGVGNALIQGNLNLGSNTRTFNISGADLDISGIISGGIGGTLTKSTGANKLTFSGSSPNTYSELTVVNAGILELAKVGARAIVGDLIVNSSGTLQTISSNQFSASLSDVLLTINGGTVDFLGNSQNIGRLDFISGTLIQAGIGGSGDLELSNASAFNPALTMTGGTTIPGNVFLTGNAVATGDVVFATTNSGSALVQGTFDLGSFDRVFNIGDNAVTVDMEFSGVIQGIGGITKSTGAGTLEFNGSSSNTYTGDTTINAGGFFLAKDDGIVALPGKLTIGSTATVQTVNQNQFGSSTSEIVLNGGTLDFNNNDQEARSLEYRTGTLTFGGASTLSLTAPAPVMALALGGGLTVASGATVSLTGAGGLQYNEALGGSGMTTFAGTLQLSASGHDFNILDGSSAIDMDITGNITGAGGFEKTGNGDLRISSTSSNSYSGLTKVSAGGLLLATPASVSAVSGDLTIENGGVVTLTQDHQIAGVSNVILKNGGSFDLGPATTTKLQSFSSEGGTVTSTGTSSLLLNTSAGPALDLTGATIPANVNISFTGVSGEGVYLSSSALTSYILGNMYLNGNREVFLNDAVPSVDLRISGSIQDGGVEKEGLGTLTFDGNVANTYVGDTVVNSGTLSLAKTGGALALPGDFFINGGSLQLAGANQIATTSNGTLSGGTFDLGSNAAELKSLTFEGGLLAGSAALTLNNSTGDALVMKDTTVPSAIPLLLTGAAGFGGIAFDATNNGTAYINSTVDLGAQNRLFSIADGAAYIDMEASAVLQNGGLTKEGPGTLLLSGASIYTGATQIDGGTLVVTGSLANTEVTVNGAGSLRGTGTVGAGAITVTNNGIVAPGIEPIVTLMAPQAIQSFTVDGNYVQSSSGTLITQIQNQTNYSQLIVTGNATLAGDLLIDFLGSYSILPGDVYTVLQAALVSGTFDNFQLENPVPYYAPEVLYSPTEVLLTFTITPIFKYIDFAPLVFASLNQQNSLLNRRMDRLHYQKAEGVRVAQKAKTSTPYQLAALDSPKTTENIVEKERSYSIDRPWEIYLGPLGSLDTVKGGKDQEKYNSYSIGAFLGADYRFCQGGIGLMASYERADGDVKHHWGDFTIDFARLALYGSYSPSQVEGLAFNAILGGGLEWYNIDRKLYLPDLMRSEGKPEGKEADAFLGLSYTYTQCNKMKWIPQISLQYLYWDLDSYHEHGTDFFSGNLSHQKDQSLRGSIGMRTNYTFEENCWKVIPEARIFYQREFLDPGHTVHFIGPQIGSDDFSFSLKGTGKDFIWAGLSLSAVKNRYTIEGNYDFEWNRNAHTHFFSIVFGVNF